MNEIDHDYCFIKDNKIYLRAFADQKERQIGDVKEDFSASILYFENRFEKLLESVNQLEEKINSSTNKGSFLMKVIHMKEHLFSYNAVGDFEGLYKRLVAIEQLLQSQVEESRKRNLLIKNNLIAELKSICETEDWLGKFNDVKSIQQRWLKTGRVSDELNEDLENEYKELVNGFFNNRNELLNVKKELNQVRINNYKEFIHQARELLKEPINAEQVEKFKKLQLSWKENGFVPKNILTPLWDEFKEIGDTFFNQVKKEGHQLNLRKRNDQKRVEQLNIIVEGLEVLGNQEFPDQKRLKSLQFEWKKVSDRLKIDSSLRDRYHGAVQLVLERSFVNKLLQTRNEGFLEEPEARRAELRQQLLKHLIKKEEEVLRNYNNDNSMFQSLMSMGEHSPMHRRYREHERKLKAKKTILDQLNKLYFV